MTRLLTVGPHSQSGVKVPEPGDVLGGKYRIERQIGSGGMGVVYEVTHLVMTEKRFAVKWLLPNSGEIESQEAARRFVREAQIAGRIHHPHVVDVYDVTIADNGCFMVMELLEGESLEARLKREQRLSTSEACRITIAAASGVAAAHAANVIHRDLKPANIFLCRVAGELPRPKVLDFGVSRFVVPESSQQSTVTRTGVLVGTPSYMASEQLRGQPCDARTDVYALAVTLYECLAGQRAYDASTYADLVVRVVTGDATDLRKLVPALPAELSSVVMRAMHHDPAQRLASIEAFASALAPYTTEASPAQVKVGRAHSPSEASAKPSQPQPRLRRWRFGLLAVALGVLAAGAWLHLRDEAPGPAVHVTVDAEAAPARVTDYSASTAQPEEPATPAVRLEAASQPAIPEADPAGKAQGRKPPPAAQSALTGTSEPARAKRAGAKRSPAAPSTASKDTVAGPGPKPTPSLGGPIEPRESVQPTRKPKPKPSLTDL